MLIIMNKGTTHVEVDRVSQAVEDEGKTRLAATLSRKPEAAL